MQMLAGGHDISIPGLLGVEALAWHSGLALKTESSGKKR
jgi:hypothetical protein